MSSNILNITSPIQPDKDNGDACHEADMGLGMYQQNFAGSRADLVSYAVNQGYSWALRDFLVTRGFLDDDWEQRLTAIGQEVGHG